MSRAARVAREAAVSRAGMYRFLSAVYLRPPGRDLLRLCADPQFVGELRVLFGAPAAGEIGVVVTVGDAEQTLADITQDYMDLFAVPGGRYVTPFEDVYRGRTVDGGAERGPLLGARAIAARRIYREAGAEMDRACRELPSHIGVEFAFMSFLCESEAAAEGDSRATEASRYRELQRTFLEEHLTGWAPELCRMIRTHAATPFYRGIAYLTVSFLVRDAASLTPDAGVDGVGCEPVDQAACQPG